jgi:hypothetical protein
LTLRRMLERLDRQDVKDVRLFKPFDLKQEHRFD